MKNLKENRLKAEYKLRILLQDTDPEDYFFNYLYELYNRLLEKGFLFPGEYKKIIEWEGNVNVVF